MDTKLNFSCLIWLFFFSYMALQAQESKLYNPSSRKSISLNGKWEYVLDPYKTGGMGGMPIFKNAQPKDKIDRVEYSFDKSETLYVPSSWNMQKKELTYFEGTVWYRKMLPNFTIDKSKRYFLHIGASNYLTTVTINGKVLGIHEGGFTPFNFELTDLLKESENVIIIGVDNTRKSENIPAEVTDWFNHGGLIRDVLLVETPKTYIANYYISLKKSSLTAKNKIINGRLELAGENLPCRASISIPELGVSTDIILDSAKNVDFNLSVRHIDLWCPENPKLYEIFIQVGEDRLSDLVGFRTIEARGKSILLNGKPVFLKGICLHDENPFRKDRANSIQDAELMLGWAEELGCNFIRLAHYPHQENIVRLADKRGILLWEELPLYWGIQWDSPKVLTKAKAQYNELIDRDYNRASSIIWSIANETPPTSARTSFLTDLAAYIRAKDTTRLISAAVKKDQEADGHPDSNYTYSDPLIEKLDILSLNEYLGWYGGLPDETRKKSFLSKYSKPIIVSEFGSAALQGFYADSLTRWSEEFQEYHYMESLNMFDKIEGLCGLTPWILVDFMSPLRQLRGIQDGWNRKGLVSERGNKKKAFYILKDYYRRK